MYYDFPLQITVGLAILVPYFGYWFMLWLFGRRVHQLRESGKLPLDPRNHNHLNVQTGKQYTYLDNDRYEDYLWVEKIDRKLGLVRVSFYRGDGKWVHSPLASSRWTHEVPTNRAFHPEDLARTRLGALFAWMNARRTEDSVGYHHSI